MDISEVAKRAGVPASTLRFYEEKGLIASIGRQGIRRQFSANVLERLALIALGRSSGFSLDDGLELPYVFGSVPTGVDSATMLFLSGGGGCQSREPQAGSYWRLRESIASCWER